MQLFSFILEAYWLYARFSPRGKNEPLQKLNKLHFYEEHTVSADCPYMKLSREISFALKVCNRWASIQSEYILKWFSI